MGGTGVPLPARAAGTGARDLYMDRGGRQRFPPPTAWRDRPIAPPGRVVAWRRSHVVVPSHHR